MFYIGIDPSLSATGLIVLSDNCSIFNQAIISSKLKGVNRLIDLEKQLTTILKGYVPARDIPVYVENYSFGSRIGQAFSIGEWGGLIRVLLTKIGYKFKLIAPTSLKKFVTGKGNSKKDLVMKAVYKKWGVDFDDDNLADAYGLARLAWSMSNLSQDKCEKYEWEVLNQIYES